jgi:hypothetical protein
MSARFVALFFACLTSVGVGGPLFAMGWLSNEPALRQSELTPQELKLLGIRSGWSSDDPSLMLFEVSNQNSGPVFCVGAHFEFKDGKNVLKRSIPNSTYLQMLCEKPPSEALKRKT